MNSAPAPASSQVPQRINLLDLDRKGLEDFFVGIGEKPFRSTQLLKWIHQQGVTDFQQMSNLSKALRARLEENCEITPPRMILEQASRDGTRKWLLQMSCGNRVETVYIPEEGRGTLCVSSQVGCALECSFCSTARQGFNRNLNVSEIIGQVWMAVHQLGDQGRVTNVVMMGMGEPLLNFTNVVSAMDLMMDDLAYGLSKRRVTLSTSGIVPAMDRLREVSNVSMAVSLHATTNELRNELVPVNSKYPLEELLPACQRYAKAEHKRKITFEYVMLDGVNDSPEQARQLCRLLSGIPSKINLIPFNPFPKSGYRCSSPQRIERFRQVLHNAGLVTTTRKTRGEDIDAACGQLVGKVEDRTRRTHQTDSQQPNS